MHKRIAIYLAKSIYQVAECPSRPGESAQGLNRAAFVLFIQGNLSRSSGGRKRAVRPIIRNRVLDTSSIF